MDDKELLKLRIFLITVFSLMIFALVMGMTKDLRHKLKHKMEQNTVVKEKPKTVLWQTEL
jgi:hypothetical protein